MILAAKMRFVLFIALTFSGILLRSQPCTLFMDVTADCGLNCSGTAAAYSSGQSPFTYLWQPGGQTTQQITNLCPGSYAVTVTDSLGCVSTDSVVVSGSPILNVWISSITNPSCVGCADGSASGSVNGGTPGYYPFWSPPIGFGLYTVSGIPAGTYTFCVTDTFGCTSCVDTVLQDPLGIQETELFESNSQIEVYDLSGRIVFIGESNGWGDSYSSTKLSGYFLVVETFSNGQKRVRKLILSPI